MRDVAERVIAEVRKAVRDKDDVIQKVFMAILAQGHILLEDVPGTGKTTLALSFSRALGIDNKRVQFTADTLPSDVVGFSVFNQHTGQLDYKPGAVMTNLLLADEMNRTSSKTQSALLEAMEEKNVTIDGVTYPLPNPFVVLATQNPVGSAGTMLLPNSQLDRFILKTSMGYPSDQGLVEILRERHSANPVNSIEPVFSGDELCTVIAAAMDTHVSDGVYAYVGALVNATRQHDFVELGVSTRGALALCRMAKALAFVEGRDFVVPDDVSRVFADVCAHRLVLNANARLNDADARAIIAEVLERVPLPQLQTANPLKG